MPNNGRITVCPFYRYERKSKIVCEDAPRRFRYRKHKERWMDTYCDDRWQDCMWAKVLERVYQEGGDMTAHTIEELKKELQKADTMLGRCEKRLEAKDEEIRKLRKKNRILEDKVNRLSEYQRREQAMQEQITRIAALYESRFAYLLDTFADGSFREDDAVAWAKGKEFAVVGDVEDGKRIWKAVTREVQDGDPHGDRAQTDHEEEQSADSGEQEDGQADDPAVSEV